MVRRQDLSKITNKTFFFLISVSTAKVWVPLRCFHLPVFMFPAWAKYNMRALKRKVNKLLQTNTLQHIIIPLSTFASGMTVAKHKAAEIAYNSAKLSVLETY